MSSGVSEVAAGVREGDVLAGKYRIDKILGAGGMGVVVAAHHVHLDEKVAIKFLLPDALDNPEAVERFAREARAAAKIKSQHVARVIDVGTLDTGAPYIVMEYLEGGDLAAWIRKQGAMSIEQAVEFVLQACEALADAHALGIVHRDLKPSNLFWVRGSDGMLSIKVLDFGISKITGLSNSGPDMGMTRTSAIMGSPFYMSPEQMQSSRDVDARTDIWAIGIILYELLAGRPPFGGDSMPEVCINVSTKPPAALRSVRPDAPAAFEAVLLKCLAKDREKRYSNIAELAWALVEFGPKRSRNSVERISRVIQNAGLSASAMSQPTSSNPAPSGTWLAGTISPWGQTNGSGKGLRSKAGLFFAIAVVIAVLGAGAAFVVNRNAGARAPEAAPGLVTQVGASEPIPPASAVSPAAALPEQAAAAEPSMNEVPTPTPSAIVSAERPRPPAIKPGPSKVPGPAIANPAPPRPSKAETKPAAPAAPNQNELGGRL